jgi:dinuclear metal center YbgI/SA1388 family protein
MVHRRELQDYLADRLGVAGIDDYCPNGLQVEGRSRIERLVTGVTASARLLRAALEAEADAVLVHHGFFWKGEPAVVAGMKAERLRLLLRNDVNLFAYHLPLDVDEQCGNNACLADKLGARSQGAVAVGGIPGLLWHGQLDSALPAAGMVERLRSGLDREPIWVDGGPSTIRRVAWCAGGGQRFVAQAAGLGVDAYVSGEISEPTAHEARELGLHYFAAGHHATERDGVQALAAELVEQFGIEHRFIDDPNPA